MNELLLPTDSKLLDVPPELVVQVAVGAVDENTLAAAYGYSVQEWDTLQSLPHFQKEVAAKRAELELNGYTRSLKTALKYDVLADKNFALMVVSDDMALRLKYQRQLAEEANLMPKLQRIDDPNAALGRLQISIEIPGASATQLNTIDVTPTVVDIPTPPPAKPPGELPAVLNTDLAGGLRLPEETF